jgi:hypothetical protein
VLRPSLSLVAERFARQLTVLTGSRCRLGGQPGIRRCEMTDADELERRDPLRVGKLRELALLRIAAGKQLPADMVFTHLAQILERRRPAAALRQAVTAIAEGVRTCRKPPITLIAPRGLGRSTRDRTNLGQRDLGPGVEHQAVAGAPCDLADVLAAVLQAHDDALARAHRLQHAEHQTVGIARRRRREPPHARPLDGLIGANRLAHPIMQLERGAQIAPAMLANMNTLDLTAMHAVQQTAGLLGALRRVLR